MRFMIRVLVLSCLVAPAAWSELFVEITKGYDNPAIIAVVPFSAERNTADGSLTDINQIVESDLARSGQFSPLPLENMLSYPNKESEVYYRDWRILDVQYLIFGQVIEQGGNTFIIRFYLADILRKQILIDEELPGTAREIRSLAHYISDVVYEKITGVPGAYSTKLLYVSVEGVGTQAPIYQLLLSDADGAGSDILRESDEPILSPSWSPDGRRIAYVSFSETGQSAVIVQNLLTGKRKKIVEFSGRSSAPAFSPDGTKLALVLSRKGNPDLYIKNLKTNHLRRVTKHYRIDTEPSWTPDGKSLIFTSGRSGKPQIYRYYLRSKKVQRLTFGGNYNAHGTVLRDGKRMVFVHRKSGLSHIAIMDLEEKNLKVLTQTALDESPSVSPNGMMLIYATHDQGKGVLAVMSLDGRVHYKLPDTRGNAVREPSWSPYLIADPDADNSAG